MLPLKNLFPEWECKGSKIFLNANTLVKFISIFAVPLARDCFLLRASQWGCFGFDSIRHWTVSTPGSVGQPVNLDLRTISWQQLLCTRCVVCKAHYLNPRRQGCAADEYPSSL